MPLHFAYATLADEIAHLLAAAVLTLSFASLYQRRLRAMISVYVLQASVLGLDAAWQGLMRPAATLWLIAILTFTAKAVALPTLLRRAIQRPAADHAIEPVTGVVPLLVFGVGLVTLAAAAVMPIGVPPEGPTREELALAVSVVLLGALMMVVQRHAAGQVIGFLSIENGFILAAITTPGMPLLFWLACASLGLASAVVFAFWWRAEVDRAGVPQC
jgi:hydrogenase-4 component E